MALEDLDINTISDFDKLRGFSFKLPTLSELSEIPDEIVFTRSGRGLIDFTMGIAVDDEGDVSQTIRVVSGQPVELLVKPQHAAEKVTGYLVLKQGGVPRVNLPLSFQLASALFAASDAPNKSDSIRKIEEEFLLLEFAYEDFDKDGAYTASFDAPLVSGTYDIITIIDYKEERYGQKEIRFVLLVDPEGYVYEIIGGKEARIPNAVVSIFWKNPETNVFQLWPAGQYSQTNPQTTGSTGEYAFLVPPGDYYIGVVTPGYAEYKTEEFQVLDGRGVHRNIELSSEGFLKQFRDPWVVLNAFLSVVLIFLIFHFYRDHRARGR